MKEVVKRIIETSRKEYQIMNARQAKVVDMRAAKKQVERKKETQKKRAE